MVKSALRQSLALNRRQRAVLATRNRDVRAGAATDELPGVALEIDGRGALARGAGSGGAVVLALKGDAVAFHLAGRSGGIGFGLGQRSGAGDGCNRGRDRTGENRGGDGFHRHAGFPLVWRMRRATRAHAQDSSERNRSYTGGRHESVIGEVAFLMIMRELGELFTIASGQ